MEEIKGIKINNSEEKDTLEDYRFIANCLQIGFENRRFKRNEI
ncbi:MAG: hypothetical protein V8R30_05255 [Clostridia bacterium]